jgi:hypothetical protein
LKWPPEIGPSAYAPDNTVRPNARETPSKPIPTSGNAAASTALPQPPRTSQNVPINSAEILDNTADSLGGWRNQMVYEVVWCVAARDADAGQNLELELQSRLKEMGLADEAEAVK